MEYQANNGHSRSNVAVYGMLLSICLVMGYLENLIPIAVPVPGIKPGFSNIVIIWVLYSMGIKYCFVGFFSVICILFFSVLQARF